MQSPKIILTDLDGVIRHWPSDALHEKEAVFGLPAGHLFSICFEKKLLLQAVTGQITDEAWRGIVKAKLSHSISEPSAQELVNAWTHSNVQIDHKIIEIYKAYFPEAKIIMATNATTRLPLDMKRHHLEGLFDGVLNSSKLGVAKPDHHFFKKVMQQLGTRFNEVIYIDDSAENVRAGKQFGIRSHHYQNHAQLCDFLAAIKRPLPH